MILTENNLKKMELFFNVQSQEIFGRLEPKKGKFEYWKIRTIEITPKKILVGFQSKVKLVKKISITEKSDNKYNKFLVAIQTASTYKNLPIEKQIIFLQETIGKKKDYYSIRELSKELEAYEG